MNYDLFQWSSTSDLLTSLCITILVNEQYCCNVPIPLTTSQVYTYLWEQLHKTYHGTNNIKQGLQNSWASEYVEACPCSNGTIMSISRSQVGYFSQYGDSV